MNVNLSVQRCFNHAEREAVARCPGCARYFCRECVVEHENRVLCAQCLPESQQTRQSPLPRLNTLVKTVKVLFSLALIWFFFYAAGQALLLLPATFHEPAHWPSGLMEE